MQIGSIDDRCPDLDGTLCPSSQFRWRESVVFERKGPVVFVELEGVKQRVPLALVSLVKFHHCLAFFEDVWPERPLPLPSALVPVDHHQARPKEMAVVFQQLLFVDGESSANYICILLLSKQRLLKFVGLLPRPP